MNDYYVYGLRDPRNSELFYIGKGKGQRYKEHFKNIKELEKTRLDQKKGINPNKTQRIKDIIDSGNELIYEFFAENLSEAAAFALEEILIERYGRTVLNNGQLLNLEVGGKWAYPKLTLTENEKTTIEDVQKNFPELIPILEKHPHIAKEPKIIKWWEAKIPAKRALYQYSLTGEFLATHNVNQMTAATGMSWRLIDQCIEKNKGYAFGYQWTRVKKNKLPNLKLLTEEDLLKLQNYKPWKIYEITETGKKYYVEQYKIRNQEVEE